MAIEVKVGELEPQNTKPFPKLMIWNKKEANLIILFKSEKNGTVLSSKTVHWDVGDVCEDFDMLQFTDYNEPITLKNK